MSLLTLKQPETYVSSMVRFIKRTYQNASKQNAVIALSGGVDSSLCLTLLVKALGVNHVFPITLPYDKRSKEVEIICRWNQIPLSQLKVVSIKSAADKLFNTLEISDKALLRRGNVMARLRMILLYDYAKTLEALVCGTENKSERLLGYFTRFGDEASDLEPLYGLYKTQVFQIARYLDLPERILKKPPSAELWPSQTDEEELGFSYTAADQVLSLYYDQKHPAKKIQLKGVSAQLVDRILTHVKQNNFKSKTPYVFKKKSVDF